MNPAFDPCPPLRVLSAHDVRFVIIGGIAGVLLGSPSLTFDLDICYDEEAVLQLNSFSQRIEWGRGFASFAFEQLKDLFRQWIIEAVGNGRLTARR